MNSWVGLIFFLIIWTVWSSPNEIFIWICAFEMAFSGHAWCLGQTVTSLLTAQMTSHGIMTASQRRELTVCQSKRDGNPLKPIDSLLRFNEMGGTAHVPRLRLKTSNGVTVIASILFTNWKSKNIRGENNESGVKKASSFIRVHPLTFSPDSRVALFMSVYPKKGNWILITWVQECCKYF